MRKKEVITPQPPRGENDDHDTRNFWTEARNDDEKIAMQV